MIGSPSAPELFRGEQRKKAVPNFHSRGKVNNVIPFVVSCSSSTFYLNLLPIRVPLSSFIFLLALPGCFCYCCTNAMYYGRRSSSVVHAAEFAHTAQGWLTGWELSREGEKQENGKIESMSSSEAKFSTNHRWAARQSKYLNCRQPTSNHSFRLFTSSDRELVAAWTARYITDRIEDYRTAGIFIPYTRRR